MTAELSVNLNAIAQLRNRRDLPWPSVVGMGRIALDTGAIGLTVHPRPDERHIRRHDVDDLAQLLGEAAYADKEYNIEGYPDERFLSLVESVKPTQVTLVPDDPSQATSDHGWDFGVHGAVLKEIVKRIQEGGMRVALFIDSDVRSAYEAAEMGTDRVEMYTGPYGAAYGDIGEARRELAKLSKTAAAALECGLEVNAGHDLTVVNLPSLVEVAPNLAEVSIGHGLTADALLHGMEESVKRFLIACGQG